MARFLAITEGAKAGVATMPWATMAGVTMALLLGTFMIVGVGFAPEALHNAAHDVRHGMAFPCH